MIVSLLISTSFFSACSNRAVKKDDNITGTQTVKETTFVGKLLVGALTLYGTGGNIEKALKATKFAGNASGYHVGEKLAIIQKKYKDKEESLIEKILQIDTESNELKEKILQLTENLVTMQEEIENLEKNKIKKENIKKEKEFKQVALKKKLKQKKNRLEILLNENKKISKKISFSKRKANEYKYEAEDKKEILKSISFLEKSSKNHENSILQEISSLDKMISTLG